MMSDAELKKRFDAMLREQHGSFLIEILEILKPLLVRIMKKSIEFQNLEYQSVNDASFFKLSSYDESEKPAIVEAFIEKRVSVMVAQDASSEVDKIVDDFETRMRLALKDDVLKQGIIHDKGFSPKILLENPIRESQIWQKVEDCKGTFGPEFQVYKDTKVWKANFAKNAVFLAAELPKDLLLIVVIEFTDSGYLSFSTYLRHDGFQPWTFDLNSLFSLSLEEFFVFQEEEVPLKISRFMNIAKSFVAAASDFLTRCKFK